MEFDNLSKRVIGLAIEVHKSLGPGLLENTYKECLALEFKENGINFEKEKELPVVYKGLEVACGYRIDLKVENSLIIELKSVSSLNSIYDAQILTYMKLSKIPIGLLINFNVKILKDGIKRFVLKEFNREGREEHEGKIKEENNDEI
jgi:GxxExxY protein